MCNLASLRHKEVDEAAHFLCLTRGENGAHPHYDYNGQHLNHQAVQFARIEIAVAMVTDDG